jgi:hypothetical protein
MEFIIKKIILLITLILVYVYTNKISKPMILKKYLKNSTSQGKYDSEYEKKLKQYLDKNLNIITILTSIIMLFSNIYIGFIFMIILYLLNPIPK